MAVEIHEQATADTTASRLAHDECPGGISCPTQGLSGSCAGNNELPNSCLDLVLGEINEVQQGVLRMRVSYKCKGSKPSISTTICAREIIGCGCFPENIKEDEN
jgi:hypothetical protein